MVRQAKGITADPLTLNRKDGLHYFQTVLRAAQISEAGTVTQAAADYLRGNSELVNAMFNHWYTELRTNGPDYSVYDSVGYLVESWNCWETYSKKYLREMQRPGSLPPHGVLADTRDSKIIVDLGNGIGVSTVALTFMYPDAQVIGTNVKGSLQYQVAEVLGDTHGFTMVDHVSDLPSNVDLVFASEYFEHFQEPVDHLNEVLAALNPKRLLIANTFGGDSTGHFDDYIIDGDLVPGRLTGRRFNAVMRAHGYTQAETGFWNNRPAYWKAAA